MYVNTTAEVKALTDYCCTSANAVDVVRHIYETHGEDTEILFGPGHVARRLRREGARPAHACVGRGVPCPRRHPPRRHRRDPRRPPGADFLIHPECGCSTSVMEYVAAGDIAAEGVHMLSTGGMLKRSDGGEVRRTASRARARAAPPEARSWRPRSACSPAADGRPGRRVHPRQRRGLVRVHEDDHADEAARRAGEISSRLGSTATAERAGADRPDGRDRAGIAYS